MGAAHGIALDGHELTAAEAAAGESPCGCPPQAMRVETINFRPRELECGCVVYRGLHRYTPLDAAGAPLFDEPIDDRYELVVACAACSAQATDEAGLTTQTDDDDLPPSAAVGETEVNGGETGKRL